MTVQKMMDGAAREKDRRDNAELQRAFNVARLKGEIQRNRRAFRLASAAATFWFVIAVIGWLRPFSK